MPLNSLLRANQFGLIASENRNMQQEEVQDFRIISENVQQLLKHKWHLVFQFWNLLQPFNDDHCSTSLKGLNRSKVYECHQILLNGKGISVDLEITLKPKICCNKYQVHANN